MATMSMISFTPIMAISSKSLMLLWVLLEINTMAFIFMSMSIKNMYISKDKMMLFFMIQSISSITLLMATLQSTHMINLQSNFFSTLVMISMLMKMGMFPLFQWMINLSKMIKMSMIFLISSWQKIIPIFIILKNLLPFLMILMLVNVLASTLMQFMTMKIKLLIIMSSMNHTAWMIIPSWMNYQITWMYLLIYSLILMFICIYTYKDMVWSTMTMAFKKMNISIMFMSMAGIPPLMGFLLKWIVMSSLMHSYSSSNLIMWLMLMATINFYIYTRMMYMSIMSNNENKTNYKIKTTKFLMPSIYLNIAFPFYFMLF